MYLLHKEKLLLHHFMPVHKKMQLFQEGIQERYLQFFLSIQIKRANGFILLKNFAYYSISERKNKNHLLESECIFERGKSKVEIEKISVE
jgi:hypothetical protein